MWVLGIKSSCLSHLPSPPFLSRNVYAEHASEVWSLTSSCLAAQWLLCGVTLLQSSAVAAAQGCWVLPSAQRVSLLGM